MTHPADEAIRAVIRNTALATIEACAERMIERYSGHTMARDLLSMKDALADEMVGLAMECADETAESPVHAVRALVDGFERTEAPTR